MNPSTKSLLGWQIQSMYSRYQRDSLQKSYLEPLKDEEQQLVRQHRDRALDTQRTNHRHDVNHLPDRLGRILVSTRGPDELYHTAHCQYMVLLKEVTTGRGCCRMD